MKFEVGKRYLVDKQDYYQHKLIEVKILEVSPTGQRIKFEYVDGSTSWENLWEWEIVEELEEAK